MQTTKVVIVGAGISGLSAAEYLQKHGITDYKILEASDRIGGRIHTIEVGDGEKQIFELGAQWIHGQKKNPLYELAKEHGLVETRTKKKKKQTLYVTETGEHIDKKKIDRIHGKVYTILDDAEDFCTSETDYPDLNENIEDYLQQHLEEFLSKREPEDRLEIERILHNVKLDLCAYCGCDNVGELSVKEHGRYEELKGDDVTINKGYNSVIDIVRSQIPPEKILCNHSVKTIHWKNVGLGVEETQQIKVECESGTIFLTNHLILTVSLGILKAKSEALFSPTLPKKKLDAIEKHGFGVADKVILIFDKPVLGKKVGCINFMWNPSQDDDGGDVDLASWCRKMYDMSVINGNAVFGWLTGKEAMEMESLRDDQVTHDMLQVLKTFLKRDDIPRPVRLIRTRWGTNPTTLGSYSFARVGSSVQDILDLQEPIMDEQSIKPVLLFAGEATHERFYSSVHGAMLSGQREAQRLVDLYQCGKSEKCEKDRKPEKEQNSEKQDKKGKTAPASSNEMLSGQRQSQRLIDLYKDEEKKDNSGKSEKGARSEKPKKERKTEKNGKKSKPSGQAGEAVESQPSTTYKLKLFNST